MEALPDGLRIIGCGRIAPDPRWSMDPHAHAFHELVAINRGIMHVTLSEARFEATAGEVLFYRAGCVHEERSDPSDPLESLFVAFEWSAVPPDLPLRVNDAAGRIRELASWLYAEWASVATGGAGLCGAFFHSLLLEWTRLRSAPEPALVGAVRAYLRQHLAEHLDVDRLASVAGSSRYHFIRTYRRQAGRTPMAEVRAERVRAAHTLLMTTDLPLKDIAAKCGLSDEYHLSHLVKRYLNATPREIRASVKH